MKSLFFVAVLVVSFAQGCGIDGDLSQSSSNSSTPAAQETSCVAKDKAGKTYVSQSSTAALSSCKFGSATPTSCQISQCN